MKKMMFAAALIVCSLTFKVADAQLKINFNLNIGSQPDWGPTGYNHVEYYYMPDIDAYYYVPNHQYVYLQNNAWIRSGSLPPRYSNYDVYHSYKVVINQPEPWRNQPAIRAKYAAFKGRRNQTIIRDTRDNKYRNHWQGDQRRDNGYDRDHGRGNGSDNGRDNNGHDNGHHYGNDNRGNGRPDRGHGTR